MCIFCEEPFRSIIAGLSALGIIAIFRWTWKTLGRKRSPEAAERAS